MAMSFESLPIVIDGFSSFLSHAMAYSMDEPYKHMPFGVWAVMDTAMPLFLLPLLFVIFASHGDGVDDDFEARQSSCSRIL